MKERILVISESNIMLFVTTIRERERVNIGDHYWCPPPQKKKKNLNLIKPLKLISH